MEEACALRGTDGKHPERLGKGEKERPMAEGGRQVYPPGGEMAEPRAVEGRVPSRGLERRGRAGQAVLRSG